MRCAHSTSDGCQDILGYLNLSTNSRGELFIVQMKLGG